ncbi:MAG TPA: hypothetical protein VHM90_07290 [Phycisphaerae bacterium]|nr:hypothetical protein [Phycisphaerae bacterium]
MTPAAQKDLPRPSAAGAARELPPEWAIERLIKTLGRIPAAAGKTLDALAKNPVLGPVVRLFSSVWFGIIILGLIGIYIAIGSGFHQLREAMEMTDLQFFDWWPMRILLVCLVLDLSIVTLRRIPLTLFKLGSWTVHIGIVTLITGSVWYFSQKVEGSVRIYLNQSVDHYYDVTERALYAYPMNADGTFDTQHPTITALPTLPIFFEHLAATGNPIDIAVDHAIPGSDARIRIVGYYPCAILQEDEQGLHAAGPGEKGMGSAVQLQLGKLTDSFGKNWLLGSEPRARILEANFPFAIEFLHHPDAQRVKDLQASFQGAEAITVRIPKLNIDRTYVVKQNEPIAVEGSPYTLIPRELQSMPMLSPGYERTSSSLLFVDVSRKDADKVSEYQRMCIFRYPELSADRVMENGAMARKKGVIDRDIQIVFHDAARTESWVVEADDGALSLITREAGGKSSTQPLGAASVSIPVPGVTGGQILVQVTDRIADAAISLKPDIIPPAMRPRGQQVMEILQFSMIDVEASQGNWTQRDIHIPFSPYAQVGTRPEGDQPAIVELPGGKRVGLLLATTEHKLPSTLTLTNFEPIKYPGAAQTIADYRSTLLAADGKSEPRKLQPHLNNPVADHGLFYFQSAWDGDENAPPEKRFSVIGVGNRPGIYVMMAGAILIALGIGYAFYIKPLLLKAKKEFLAKWAAARGSQKPSAV